LPSENNLNDAYEEFFEPALLVSNTPHEPLLPTRCPEPKGR